ncbi:MAG: GntR family transcriptional regulator [Lachnospiraceae bacterium]|nr:GntR family transcriptional regulator [Lachnospiraceae bacterium]
MENQKAVRKHKERQVSPMVVDFSELKLNEESPIYMQIVRFIKIKMVNRQVRDGDELPSRRVLSAMLEVNPNTIQKAYRLMEEEGLLVSFAGSKSLLQFDESLVDKYRRELLVVEAEKYIEEVKKMGLTEVEAVELIKTNW